MKFSWKRDIRFILITTLEKEMKQTNKQKKGDLFCLAVFMNYHIFMSYKMDSDFLDTVNLFLRRTIRFFSV